MVNVSSLWKFFFLLYSDRQHYSFLSKKVQGGKDKEREKEDIKQIASYAANPTKEMVGAVNGI